MLYIRKVSGNSMLPTLQHGDYIIATKNIFKHYKVNDIVIVQHAKFSEIIKRIISIDSNEDFWLAGDGADTLSSEKMGAIKQGQILAKLCWHIHP
ncbi:MAG: S24/S26 family peptidase [Oceanospirillaceae bacterium]